jgi:F-type H+-transporting ATPase subunit a
MIFAVSFFEHVLDTSHWHFFETANLGFKLPWPLTKFVVLQLIAAGLIAFLFIRLARRIKDGQPAHGWGWNALEVLLTFIRDEVARPVLEEDTDKYVPFLWTIFLFILTNNLMGVIPFMGSATGSILVTGALAICAFFLIHGAAVVKHGPIHYIKSYYPHIDAPGGFFIGLFIAVIEIIGHGIKAFVLAVRLFANIFAGHTVLAVILSFIALAKNTPLFLHMSISVGSVLFIVALSFLEIFVAFLQAYVFVFLTTLFLSMTLHPEH